MARTNFKLHSDTHQRLYDAIDNSEWKRVFRFLLVHGHLDIVDREDIVIPSKSEQIGLELREAGCIANTANAVLYEPFQRFEYTEGYADFVPTLHAWGRNLNDGQLLEPTWTHTSRNSKSIYLGVSVPRDFMYDIAKEQWDTFCKTGKSPHTFKNMFSSSDSSDHPKIGTSLLTFKPLVNGEFSSYPMGESERMLAVDRFHEFQKTLDRYTFNNLSTVNDWTIEEKESISCGL